MTFSSAVQCLRPGDAIKRESWRGYVTREAKVGEDQDFRDAPFDITFVQGDGSKAVYSFGTDTPEVPAKLSHELLDAFMHDDWIRGSADAFERARVGEGAY